LIEGIYEEQKIYFHHYAPIEEGKEVFLNVSIETINQRMADS
jgi:predicted thioesterase